MLDYMKLVIFPVLVNVVSQVIIAGINRPPVWRRLITFVISAIAAVLIAAFVMTAVVSLSPVPQDRSRAVRVGLASTPAALEVFSDFRGCRPINNYQAYWGIFNDNPFNGDSDASVRTESFPQPTRACYALIKFRLGAEIHIEKGVLIKPFCGIFSRI